MHVQFEIPAAGPRDRVFLTWTPVEAQARLVDGPGGGGTLPVTLQNGGAIGQLLFDVVRTDQGADSLVLDLNLDGSPHTFWVAGKFLEASQNYGDAVIEALDAGSGDVLGSQACMVRVRKNAETLSSVERDRFLNAMALLNDSGAGRFSDFRDVHVSAAIQEAHGASGFLPWHRIYILDLERELQAIDDETALPYWRFDEPAPKLLNLQFIGVPSSSGVVQFSAGHPLLAWATDGQIGILRRMNFNRLLAPPGVLSQAATLRLGGTAPNGRYGGFRSSMEGNPHGRAHVSFSGFVSSIPTAARDPLFFMLHCNVDRLWALWQWLNQKMSPDTQNAYVDGFRVGHRLNDTMWPWNEVTGPPRPSTAPGGPLAESPDTSAPGDAPSVRDTLDFQNVAGAEPQNFAYDNVPFELDTTGTV